MNSFALIKENLIFSLNSTVPIFLLIILGWFLMQIKLFNKDFTAVADKYVFKVALPVSYTHLTLPTTRVV